MCELGAERILFKANQVNLLEIYIIFLEFHSSSKPVGGLEQSSPPACRTMGRSRNVNEEHAIILD